MITSRPAQPDPAAVAAALLARKGLKLVSCRKVQTLWAGYGFICEVRAIATDSHGECITSKIVSLGGGEGEEIRLILKLISPPPLSGSGGLHDDDNQDEGEDEDEGHLRKMLSYEVERYFYSSVAPQLRAPDCDDGVAVAECLATTATPMTATTQGGSQTQEHAAGDGAVAALDGVLAILMTDLRVEFPVSGEKRSQLSERQVHAAVDWLANFHGSTWAQARREESLEDLVLPPFQESARRRKRRQQQRQQQQQQMDPSKSAALAESAAAATEIVVGSRLWLNGGYTYLATRRKEFSSLQDQLGDGDEWAEQLCRPLSSQDPVDASPCVAEVVAQVLTPTGARDCESLIHGDVKSENLFTTAEHDRVAFYDFQYVGLGLGVCDLAKLFTCSIPLELVIGGGTDRRKARAAVGLEMGMEKGEEALVRKYHEALLRGRRGDTGNREYDWQLFVRHWETALVDWHRFQVSWGQWGNVDWLEARVRSILKDQGWRDWLQEAYEESLRQ